MLRLATIAAMLIFSASFAAAQPVTGPMFDIRLTEQQLNVVGKALGKMPGEEVFETRDAILEQVKAQIARANEAQADAANQQAQAAADQANAQSAALQDKFKKGMQACLEGRGYVVK